MDAAVPPDPPDRDEAPAGAEAGPGPSEAGTEWAAEVMRRHARRSWLAPLLALPAAQAAMADLPEAFVLDADLAAAARDLARVVLGAASRASAGPTDLTPEEAFAILELAQPHRVVLSQMFALQGVHEMRLGLPPRLAGPGLVNRLARVIGDSPEPPARLAVLALPLLEGLVREDEGRDFLPQPHPLFTPVVRAFDRRCYELGLRTWADALRHAASVWTVEGWRDFLLVHAAGVIPALFAAEFTRAPAEPRVARGDPAAPAGRPPAARHRRAEREMGRLSDELTQLRALREAARAEAAAARLREAELIQARDRAQARAAELVSRCEALERELREARGRLRAHEATERRAARDAAPSAAPEPPPPAPPPPADLLAGRTVFFFTGQERGAAARAQADSLRELGAAEVRLYEVRQGRPGPDSFPAGAVVVVDVRFVGHSHTEEIEARVRRSDGSVVYVPLQAGEGGLAQRLAERLSRSPRPPSR